MRLLKLLIIILALLLVLFLAWAGSRNNLDITTGVSEDGIVYETFNIEDMPCLRFSDGSVTCDWDNTEE